MGRKRTERHHLIPRSRGGTNEPHNIIEVTSTKHAAYHALVGNATPPEALVLLARDWYLLPLDVIEQLAASLGVRHILLAKPPRK